MMMYDFTKVAANKDAIGEYLGSYDKHEAVKYKQQRDKINTLADDHTPKRPPFPIQNRKIAPLQKPRYRR